ncbi:MAG: ABC transporter ATP-binding protein [Ectothiorhodospiraceae bacterium]|nr:ABC transporter ATP-binding protein [Ectothiorhodospiraceae bacterium]
MSTPADKVDRARLRMVDVHKSYPGRPHTLQGLDLAIDRGEFLTLLGPSGSGKTTALMLVAGFENPTSGDILLDGKSLVGVPPYRRGLGVVFQDLGLFPHLSAVENVAYPLRMRGQAPADALRLARDMLERVRLPDLQSRRPHQLTVGQQQRVALARALVFEPSMLLLDEPLGSLDRSVRKRLLQDIRRLHEALGITVLFVTHDQSDALTVSDRVAIIVDGRLRQVGTPSDVYDSPSDAFVARFVGESNFLPGTMRSHQPDGRCEVALDSGETVQAQAVDVTGVGARASIWLRPERIVVNPAHGRFGNRFTVTVQSVRREGPWRLIDVRLPGGATLATRQPPGDTEPPEPGSQAEAAWSIEHCRALRPLP